jgi:hypothetical protein
VLLDLKWDFQHVTLSSLSEEDILEACAIKSYCLVIFYGLLISIYLSIYIYIVASPERNYWRMQRRVAALQLEGRGSRGACWLRVEREVGRGGILRWLHLRSCFFVRFRIVPRPGSTIKATPLSLPYSSFSLIVRFGKGVKHRARRIIGRSSSLPTCALMRS